MNRIFATFSFCVLAVGFAGQARAATPRVYAPNMTCAAVQGVIAREGSALVFTAPDLYGKVVRDGAFCSIQDQVTGLPAIVKTRDSKECFIGYACRIRQ